jgi:3-hydroxybutyryl-CoA dehydratase
LGDDCDHHSGESTLNDSPTGYYFEDYQVGQRMVTRGRTITEADIVQFGSLTGDFNPMHFDAEYMKNHMIGQRIAHGLLTVSYAVGQAYQLGFMEKTVLAFRSMDMKFSIPVYIGDTIHTQLTVTDLKEAARLGGGLVTLEIKIINQENKTVQKGELVVLVASRPTEKETSTQESREQGA